MDAFIYSNSPYRTTYHVQIVHIIVGRPKGSQNPYVDINVLAVNCITLTVLTF